MTHHPTPPPLDADIVDQLHDALMPEPMDAALAARVKRRVLQRIAEEQRAQHLTVHAHQGVWQAFGPGVQLKLLHAAGDTWSYLLKLERGAQLPTHRHPIDEECMVLEGTVQIGELQLGAGGFHLGRKDVLHAPITAVEPALLFLRGARPEAELLV
ncbi:MAG: cupin domain-containing protein [Burkholderiaceae bacterium]|nr:cupin domain-containing protein [Burkholderiaceae bacterium]